jgi:mono/diheme cytochrome c family protein
MEALHATGGVPYDWKLTPAPGDAARGRAVFEAYGCASCHLVQGETFAGQGARPGPELTGMGAHHPPAYFVESILNPNAIVIEGEGYAGPSGLSTMPAYPDMSLVDLTDVVAYLSSLTTGHNHAMMMAQQNPLPSALRERPAPPPQAGAAHLVMRFDVQQGRLAEFERWFRDEGRAKFLATDGLTAIDTYVTSGMGGPAVVSIFTFRDQQAAAAFLDSPDGIALGERWDSFIGPHGHTLSLLPPVYRAESLSARPER